MSKHRVYKEIYQKRKLKKKLSLRSRALFSHFTFVNKKMSLNCKCALESQIFVLPKFQLGAALRILMDLCQNNIDDEGYDICRSCDILKFTLPKCNIRELMLKLVEPVKNLYVEVETPDTEEEQIKSDNEDVPTRKKREFKRPMLMRSKNVNQNENESSGENETPRKKQFKRPMLARSKPKNDEVETPKKKREFKRPVLQRSKGGTGGDNNSDKKPKFMLLPPKPAIKKKLSGVTVSFLRSRILRSFSRMKRSSSIHRKGSPNNKDGNGEDGKSLNPRFQRGSLPGLAKFANRRGRGRSVPLSQIKKTQNGDEGNEEPEVEKKPAGRQRILRPPMGLMRSKGLKKPPARKVEKSLEEQFDEDEEKKKTKDLERETASKLYMKINKGVSGVFDEVFCFNDIPSLPSELPDDYMKKPENSKIDFSPPPCSMYTQKGKSVRNEDRLCVVGGVERLFDFSETDSSLEVPSSEEEASKVKRVKKPDQLDFYAVFDGHGGQGASEFCKSFVYEAIVQRVQDWSSEESVIEGIKKAYDDVDVDFCRLAKKYGCTSGATATVVLCVRFGEERKLYLANCGDSWGYIFRTDNLTEESDDEEDEEEETEDKAEGEEGKAPKEKKKYVEIVAMTTNHKPAQEKDRIVKAGGRVTYFYGKAQVNGALTVSRSIGDFKHSKFVIATPDVKVVKLEKLEEGCWGFLIASDGLWDKVTIRESSWLVHKMQNDRDIARQLVKLSVSRGSKDDTTAVFSFL